MSELFKWGACGVAHRETVPSTLKLCLKIACDFKILTASLVEVTRPFLLAPQPDCMAVSQSDGPSHFAQS